MKRPVQYWPLLVALIGVAGLVYGGWKFVQSPPRLAEDGADETPEEDFTNVATDPGEQWAEVKSQEIPEYLDFPGRVRTDGELPVRAPQGMRVPIVKIHHEMGDFVEKGEPMISFARERIEEAIAQAKESGDTDKVERFESYLAADPLRAPCDGRVATIWTDLGNVPYDEGIPLFTIVSADSFALDVSVPKDVAVRYASIDLEVETRIEGLAEPVMGVIVAHDATAPDAEAVVNESDHVRVTIALRSAPGIEKDMIGYARLPHGTKEIPLVPKPAVEWRGDVPVVRALEDGEILERTIRIARDTSGWRTFGDFYVVEYGVFAGQGVIVPASQ